jgi:PAS domain S-box-containing protein
VIEWDGDLRITGWSKGAERIFGWTAQEAVGSIIGRDLKLIHEDDAQEVEEVLGRLLSGEEHIGVKNYNYRKDGTEICCEWYNSVLHEDDEGSVMSIALDITRKESLEQELRDMADRDPLTDLPNRRVFDRRIAATTQQDEISTGDTAILYLDLDGLKRVNDRYGHEVGDELLRAVGRRLSTVLRSGDSLARLGGDEFAAIIEGLPGSGSIMGDREVVAV